MPSESQIDPIWLKGPADYIAVKCSELYNVVTHNGQSTTGMLVALIFEGRYEAKENGLARAAREEAALQKMFTSSSI